MAGLRVDQPNRLERRLEFFQDGNERAASNRGIFFDGETGRAKSVAEIYRALGTRIEQEAQNFAGPSSIAEAQPSPTDATGVGHAPAPRRLDFAGLQLSPPVASMLDTLTLAALKLAGGTPLHPRRTAPQG